MLSPLDDAENLQPRATVSEDQIAINDRIFFAPGSSETQTIKLSHSEQSGRGIRLRPDIEEVSIQGHTARDPNGDLNLAMSVRRSKAVVDYLVKKGSIALESRPLVLGVPVPPKAKAIAALSLLSKNGPKIDGQ